MKHRPLKTPKGALDIAKQLRWLSEHMQDIGTSMGGYGSQSGPMVRHGQQLIGASVIAKEWAEEIERAIGYKKA